MSIVIFHRRHVGRRQSVMRCVLIITLLRLFVVNTFNAHFHTTDAVAFLRILLGLGLKFVNQSNVRVQFDKGFAGLNQHVDHYHQHLVGIEYKLFLLDVWDKREHLFIINFQIFAGFVCVCLFKLFESFVSILILNRYFLLIHLL